MNPAIASHSIADLKPDTSRAARWTGRVLTGIATAALTFDAVAKLLMLPQVVEGTTQVGYPVSAIFGIGVALAICVLIHLIPRTSILGAVLLTGYLGGAVATNVRISAPLATHVLAPVYVAAVIWLGLYLRDARARALLSAVR
ncbi:MAG: DoxX family protein [Deltaproteobacteria bacterium]|nr:DoxX family protein [Deltaproteobacteria bacterium]